MSVSESYGDALGRRLNAKASWIAATRALRGSRIAATELRYEEPAFDLSRPPAEENAFLVTMFLAPFESYQSWQDGRAAPARTIRVGEAVIDDVRLKPVVHLNSPFHTVHFYVPIDALHAVADEAEAGRVEELHYRHGAPHDDRVLHGMARALLPVFAAPSSASRLFMDHTMLAVGHHIACTYGDMRPFRAPVRGGLTALQERRAKEFIAASVSGAVSLADVAGECGLSASRFRKAFRASVGMPPHRWLVQQRVETAKSLLRGDRPLADVAFACGFSDQSHFTHVFSAWTGMSPGVWRRAARR